MPCRKRASAALAADAAAGRRRGHRTAVARRHAAGRRPCSSGRGGRRSPKAGRDPRAAGHDATVLFSYAGCHQSAVEPLPRPARRASRPLHRLLRDVASRGGRQPSRWPVFSDRRNPPRPADVSQLTLGRPTRRRDDRPRHPVSISAALRAGQRELHQLALGIAVGRRHSTRDEPETALPQPVRRRHAGREGGDLAADRSRRQRARPRARQGQPAGAVGGP